jgi:hypothetical protein
VVPLEATVGEWAQATVEVLSIARSCCLRVHPHFASREVRILVQDVINK